MMASDCFQWQQSDEESDRLSGSIPFGWVFRASGQEAGQFVRIRAKHPPGIRNPAKNLVKLAG